MTAILPLEALLTTGRAATHPVAWQDGQWLSFAQFERRTAAWRAAFANQTGARWALYFEDSYEFAAASFGAWHAGKCVVLPSDTLPATVTRLRTEVDGFAGDWPGDLARLQPENERSATPWQALDPGAQQLVLYTSGSTGEPSAIPKKLSQLFAEVAMLARHWPEQLAEVTIQSTVSHQHIYGLLYRLLLPLAIGRPLASARLAYPEDIAAVLALGPTALVASPAHLKRLPEHLDWSKAQPHLRLMFSSGGPLPVEALPVCRALLGQVPVEIYGSSETGGIAWRQRANDEAVQQIWRLLPGVAMQIIGDGLEVRSPHLPDDDWYITSDRVQAVAQGSVPGFELLGRVDRVIKIEEKRVSLTAIERGLLDSGLVHEARVLPVLITQQYQAHERLTLGVVAVPNEAGWRLLDKQGKHALNQALRQRLGQVVEASVLPRRWRYVWALPVNSQGKTTEAALLAQFDLRRPEARLLECNNNAARLQLQVAAQSPYFDGHFPEAPILPGITQIDWAIALGRELFPLPPRFLRLEAVKFQQVIQPGADIELKLHFQPEHGVLGFNISSSLGTHASGRIVFGAGS